MKQCNPLRVIGERMWIASCIDSLAECRTLLKFIAPPRTSIYNQTLQHHKCGTIYSTWSINSYGLRNFEAMPLAFAMAGFSRSICDFRSFGFGVGSWRGPCFKNPQFIRASVWHAAGMLFWVASFRCQCHVTKILKEAAAPKYDAQVLVRTRCGCVWGSGHYPIGETMAPVICRITLSTQASGW